MKQILLLIYRERNLIVAGRLQLSVKSLGKCFVSGIIRLLAGKLLIESSLGSRQSVPRKGLLFPVGVGSSSCW